MIKPTPKDCWQHEDDASEVIDKWIADENAKIPDDIRGNLREYFHHIGICADEADLIPASVAQHIIKNSITYSRYKKEHKESEQKKAKIESIFAEHEFIAHLQALYVKLEFYSAFSEAVLLSKRANTLYMKAFSIKVKPGLLEKKSNQLPKATIDDEQLTFLVRIEKCLRMFEDIVPTSIVKYVDYDSYQIPGDTLATYLAVEKLIELFDLKDQVESFFRKYGYIQIGRSTFIKKCDKNEIEQKNQTAEGRNFFRAILMRIQAQYTILECYAEFVESLLTAKRISDFSLKTYTARVRTELLESELELLPKTGEEEKMLVFFIESGKSLRKFEHVMPVEISKYIDHDSYRISGDILSTYSLAEEFLELLELKKQAGVFLAANEDELVILDTLRKST